MDDTWFERDLPVLDAATAICDDRGEARSAEIEQATGLDPDTLQRALVALQAGGFFTEVADSGNAGIWAVSGPTMRARQAVGAWPSGDVLTKRLIAELESAAADGSRTEEERGKLRQAASWIAGFGYQVAVSALGGAGGNMMSG